MRPCKARICGEAGGKICAYLKNSEAFIMETDHEIFDQREGCSVCGRTLKEDEGRFRKVNEVFCIECHTRLKIDEFWGRT